MKLGLTILGGIVLCAMHPSHASSVESHFRGAVVGKTPIQSQDPSPSVNEDASRPSNAMEAVGKFSPAILFMEANGFATPQSSSKKYEASSETTMRRTLEDSIPLANKPMKKKSSKSHRKIKSVFTECAESCGAPWEMESSPTELEDFAILATEHEWGKPSCCSDGLSALKAKYLGQDRITLFMPDDGAVSGFMVVVDDMCGENTISKANLSAVKFVDCTKCFPDRNDLECTASDVWDYVTLENGDEVCLVSLDEKLPKDVTIYYQGNGDSTDIFPLTLHTSCSKPIYPPYAMKFGSCPGDNDMYVNLDSMTASEFHEILCDSSFLKFVDGVSSKDSSALLSDCGGQDDKTPCCKGGSSFLKTEFGGTGLSGFLTFDWTEADMYSSCIEKSSSSKIPVRFVSCADPCQTNPRTDEPCSPSFNALSVEPGDEVCFASWNEAMNQIDYHTKMPTNFDIYFVPNEGTVGVYTGRIHTSCSKPLHAPFAQALGDACSSQPTLLNLQETDVDDLSIHLAFKSGVSSVYYEAARDIGEEQSLLFDISFAGCGCSCGPTAMPSDFPSLSPAPTTSPSSGPSDPPSLSPKPSISPSAPSLTPSDAPSISLMPSTSPSSPSLAPSDAPSTSPTSSPTVPPSAQPSFTPSLFPTTAECDAAVQCREWALEFCVFAGTDIPCDVELSPPRNLLRDQTPDMGDEKKFLSPSEKLSFHREMASLLQELASLLE